MEAITLQYRRLEAQTPAHPRTNYSTTQLAEYIEAKGISLIAPVMQRYGIAVHDHPAEQAKAILLHCSTDLDASTTKASGLHTIAETVADALTNMATPTLYPQAVKLDGITLPLARLASIAHENHPRPRRNTLHVDFVSCYPSILQQLTSGTFSEVLAELLALKTTSEGQDITAVKSVLVALTGVIGSAKPAYSDVYRPELFELIKKLTVYYITALAQHLTEHGYSVVKVETDGIHVQAPTEYHDQPPATQQTHLQGVLDTFTPLSTLPHPPTLKTTVTGLLQYCKGYHLEHSTELTRTKVKGHGRRAEIKPHSVTVWKYGEYLAEGLRAYTSGTPINASHLPNPTGVELSKTGGIRTAPINIHRTALTYDRVTLEGSELNALTLAKGEPTASKARTEFVQLITLAKLAQTTTPAEGDGRPCLFFAVGKMNTGDGALFTVADALALLDNPITKGLQLKYSIDSRELAVIDIDSTDIAEADAVALMVSNTLDQPADYVIRPSASGTGLHIYTPRHNIPMQLTPMDYHAYPRVSNVEYFHHAKGEGFKTRNVTVSLAEGSGACDPFTDWTQYINASNTPKFKRSTGSTSRSVSLDTAPVKALELLEQAGYLHDGNRIECINSHRKGQAIYLLQGSTSLYIHCHRCDPTEVLAHQSINTELAKVTQGKAVYLGNAPVDPVAVLDNSAVGSGKTYRTIDTMATRLKQGRRSIYITTQLESITEVKRGLRRAGVNPKSIIEFKKDSPTKVKDYVSILENPEQYGIFLIIASYFNHYTHDKKEGFLFASSGDVEGCNDLFIKAVQQLAKTSAVFIDEADSFLKMATVVQPAFRIINVNSFKPITLKEYQAYTPQQRQYFAVLNHTTEPSRPPSPAHSLDSPRTIAHTHEGQAVNARHVIASGYTLNTPQGRDGIDVANAVTVDGTYWNIHQYDIGEATKGNTYKRIAYRVDKFEIMADENKERITRLTRCDWFYSKPVISEFIDSLPSVTLLSATLDASTLQVLGVTRDWTEYSTTTETQDLSSSLEYFKQIVVYPVRSGHKAVAHIASTFGACSKVLDIKGAKISVTSPQNMANVVAGTMVVLEKQHITQGLTGWTTYDHQTAQHPTRVVTNIMNPVLRGCNDFADFDAINLNVGGYSILTDVLSYEQVTQAYKGSAELLHEMEKIIIQAIGRLTRRTSTKGNKLLLISRGHNTDAFIRVLETVAPHLVTHYYSPAELEADPSLTASGFAPSGEYLGECSTDTIRKLKLGYYKRLFVAWRNGTVPFTEVIKIRQRLADCFTASDVKRLPSV